MMNLAAIDQFGRPIEPGAYLFTNDGGYCYQLVSLDSPTYPGYSAGAVTVAAVGIVDGQRVVGEPKPASADRFAVTVRRVSA